jgi:6-phosphogluconolactonase (cycloisomerase 2 family)
MRRVVPFLLSAATVAACSPNMATDPGPLASGAARSLGAPNGTPGAVYTQSNAAAGNALLVYDRGPDGTLTPGAVIPTGGLGAGGGLGSEGSVTLSENGEFLLVVNAGSDELSLFRLRGTAPELLATVPSGGDRPISVTEHAGIVYVVNGGAGNDIAGFRITTTGGSDATLVAIPGATRPLSAPDAGPAQIQFTPRGDAVVVTEKNTNRILSFAVDAGGAAAAPTITASPGQTPFGFAFAGNTLVVTEAQGGAPNGSTISSYAVGANGALTLVTPSLHTGESSACWFAAAKDGRAAFAANTGSSTITTVAVAPTGAVTLRTDGSDAATGTTAIDNAVSRNGRFLYQLTSGAHEVDAFLIGNDGALTEVGVQGVPAGVVGLAVK